MAALGAIGRAGRHRDRARPPSTTRDMRRRAAVALAAFDDPVAEEGLRRCLEDRDWQVRQVAEELLADE